MEMVDNTPIVNALSILKPDEIVLLTYYTSNGEYIEDRKVVNVQCEKTVNGSYIVYARDIKMSGSLIAVFSENIICFSIE